MEGSYIQTMRKRERNMARIILLLAAGISVLLTVILCRRADAAAQAEMQEHLAQEVLRFHVLANSDSDADQALKLKVRDSVLGFLEEAMAVTTCWFPDRTYGGLTFPAGNYEALRVEIGAAEGHNWWCVLYPGLCFLDSANAVVPEEGREKLKNVLTEEEYSRITATSDFKVSWFFWQRK